MKSFQTLYPLIKFLDINNKFFIFNAKSNLITEIDKNYVINKNGNNEIDTSLLAKCFDDKIFSKENFIKVVANDDELKDIVDYQLNSYIPRKFTIEVTENCNLKCKYCFFSREENNTTRKHSFRNMKIETAKKAIDFYYGLYTTQLMKVPEHKREKLISICSPTLSWWGGEPFLAFDVIKESKKYFDSLNWEQFKINIKQNKFAYFIPSNLTIMNEEIAEFLVNNNIILHVSLDGDKEENDKNRVFSENNGTFEIIMKNLEYLINKYPEYSKTSIIIQSVLADNIDTKKSYNFIAEKYKLNTLEKKILRYVSYPQKKEKMLFSDSYNINEQEELQNFKSKLNTLAKQTDKELINSLTYSNGLGSEFAALFLLEQRLEFDKMQNIDFNDNLFSCPICADGIFVSVNGDFHMCMKSDYSFPFGNVNTGIDKSKIINFYKNYISGFREKCKDCWAINFCQICPAQILYEKQFYFPTHKDCEIIKQKSSIAIKKYILFAENEILYGKVKKYFVDSKLNNSILDTGPININNLNI
ncbi:MAG: radical SAM protein [Prevotellaceae bacterium]|jgi:uncharacterized protein|nr:radical SAM protein [Prevotellaceae bacterium]